MRDSIVTGMFAMAVVASPGFAQQAPIGGSVTASSPGKVAMAHTVKATALVTAIDMASRTVRLKRADGEIFDVVAGDEVRNLDQIKVGDEVGVQYVQALTLELKKGGGALGKAESTDAVRAKPGETPGAAVGRRVTVMADVVGVDKKKKTITLKGPTGNVVVLDVKNPDHFKVVKKGDRVEADYVEALAVSVVPAPAKGAKK